MTLALNGLQAISVRLVTPWTGIWLADVDLDLDASNVAPTGAATLKVADATLAGTIDPLGSGRIGSHARARVVGGALGWSKSVKAQDFHNDATLSAKTVLEATAAEVGERLSIRSTNNLGTHLVRSNGPARRVLDGMGWFVDVDGVTVIGPRAVTPAPADVEIMAWDSIERAAMLATDTLVVPGMTLTDPTKFDGTVTIVKVEQTFSAEGARATAWCASTPGGDASDLASLLATLVRETIRPQYYAPQRYRVVDQQGDGRLVLQIIKKTVGLPDVLPLSAMHGLPGATSKPLPGTFVLVEFVNGDPSDPVVRSYGDGQPIELDLDALAIKLGDGSAPVLRLTASTITWLAAVSTLAGTVTPPDIASTKVRA